MFDHEFEDLKREFLEEATMKVSEIEANLARLDTEKEKALQTMTYLAHQLKGAGGSYGFHDVSVQADELETLLEGASVERDQIAERTSRLSETLRAELAKLGTPTS